MNKQELIKNLKSTRDNYSNGNTFRGGVRTGLGIALGEIDRLDELKVLSQEWIGENVEYAYFDILDGSGRLSSATAIIEPKKLKNLLVPKQELPVIPQFVAEAFEKTKGSNIYAGQIISAVYEYSDEVGYWLEVPSNEKLLLRAWLDGYEVEKEKLYYVPLGILRLGDKPIYLQKTLDGLDVDWSPLEHMYGYKANYHFTEKEIKDYDERFWPFAVEVSE